MDFEFTRPLTNANKLNAEVFATQIKKIQNILQSYMLLIWADHKKHANCHKGTTL